MGPQRMMTTRHGWRAEPAWDAGFDDDRALTDDRDRAAWAAEALAAPITDGGPLSDRVALLALSNPRALEAAGCDTGPGPGLTRAFRRALTWWARCRALLAGSGTGARLESPVAGSGPHR
jgi:hypothetical protein